MRDIIKVIEQIQSVVPKSEKKAHAVIDKLLSSTKQIPIEEQDIHFHRNLSIKLGEEMNLIIPQPPLKEKWEMQVVAFYMNMSYAEVEEKYSERNYSYHDLTMES